MERRVFIIEIFPGTEAEYDTRHDEIWPEMENALIRSGFHNYSLFRSNTLVIGYVECHPTIAEAGAKMAKELVSEKWGESMRDIIDYERTNSQPTFREVWHLNESA